jgi:hypothetical protein
MMDKLYYFLGLIVVVAALLGLIFLMQKLHARKLRYWNEKRSYELKLAEQLQEELEKTRG